MSEIGSLGGPLGMPRLGARHSNEMEPTTPAGVQLIISDACLGLVEAAVELFPDARWQRCIVHFYRNVFTDVPKTKVADVARMLKAIHAQEDRRSAEDKVREVIGKLRTMRLPKAAELVEAKAHETFWISDGRTRIRWQGRWHGLTSGALSTR